VILQAIGEQELPADLLDPLLSLFLEHYRANLSVLSTPYPGVLETLDVLRDRGARLAVVTNKLTELTSPLLDQLDLTRYFEVIVCGDTTGSPKPAADPAVFACRAMELAPGEALFVGDSNTDVNCARAAGCPVVVVRDGYNHGVPADKLGADAVIESFLDLV
jgi:phosphoglycolate phosphatase